MSTSRRRSPLSVRPLAALRTTEQTAEQEAAERANYARFMADALYGSLILEDQLAMDERAFSGDPNVIPYFDL